LTVSMSRSYPKGWIWLFVRTRPTKLAKGASCRFRMASTATLALCTRCVLCSTRPASSPGRSSGPGQGAFHGAILQNSGVLTVRILGSPPYPVGRVAVLMRLLIVLFE
jgi:hypothetical protein